LAVNARDAMPRGGRLTIETQSVELDVTYTHRHPGLLPGRYVLLAVSDTGCGMTEEVRRHLFEPFFTTKEKGKGTGLGLATVYAAIRQAGGHIAVYSEPSRGTTFKIYLPPSGGRGPESAEPPMPIRAGTETILVVEDDESMRMLISTVLRQNGYEVLEAAEGHTALTLAHADGRSLHLLVADIGLPEIDGPDLAQRLRAIRPNLKVLYLSGYARHAVVQHGLLEAEMHFLQKPFTPLALIQAVRAALESGGGTIASGISN
jgi:CheY-like chemotaxis protein